MKNGTAKVKCKCVHEVQDALHNGLRVANATAKQDEKTGRATVRCTVCKALHEVNRAQIK